MTQLQRPGFLQRLAPAMAGDPGRVRAALTPRFAVASTGPWDADADAAPTRATESPPPRDEAVQSAADNRAQVQAHRPDAQVPRPTGTNAAQILQPAFDAQRAAIPAAPTPSRPLHATPMHPLFEAPAVAMAPGALQLAPRDTIEADAPLHTHAPPPFQAAAPATAHIAARPPLRDSVIEQRVAARRTSAPPVVHVTIDRIDVRVPPAPPAPRPAARPRSAASATPLADYLRQRDRSGGDPRP